MERRKERAGWAKKGVRRREKPRLLSLASPETQPAILRDGLGMESPIRIAAFPTPNCLPAHSMRTGLKSGVKNEVNFVGR